MFTAVRGTISCEVTGSLQTLLLTENRLYATLVLHPVEQPATRSIAASVHDFSGSLLYESGFPKGVLDQDEVVEILRYLEDCREEGRILFPEILLTTDIGACLATIRPITSVICGEIGDRRDRFRQALKRCVPLASGAWTVVFEVTKDKLRYGVVAVETSAVGESLYEQLFALPPEESHVPVLYLRRHGTRAIHVRAAKRQTVVSLTLSDELLQADENRRKFTEKLVEQVASERKERTRRFIARLIEQACREGHGVIAGLVDTQTTSLEVIRATLGDGAYPTPPLDLTAPDYERLDAAVAIQTDSQYRGTGALARSMLECDLMTLFSADARLIGYNIYLPTGNASAPAVAGGARTRAFRSVENIPFINAALMCSQDGQTYFFERPHGS